MPVLSYDAAIDELYGIINQAWQAASGIVGYTPEIRWPGVQNSSPEPQDKYWARPTFKTVKRSQSALQVINDTKRYTTIGLLYFQIFAPKSADDTLSLGRQLGELVKLAFQKQSPSGSIWFRNQSLKELDPTDTCYPILISVETEWDEIN